MTVIVVVKNMTWAKDKPKRYSIGLVLLIRNRSMVPNARSFPATYAIVEDPKIIPNTIIPVIK